jgi:hypothetical protein
MALKRHEVKLTINITAYVIAGSENNAQIKFESELEKLIVGKGRREMSPDIEVDDRSFDLQDSEATSL